MTGSGGFVHHGPSYEDGASRFDDAGGDLENAEAQHAGLRGQVAEQLDGWEPGLGSGITQVEETLAKALAAARKETHDTATGLRASNDTMAGTEVRNTQLARDAGRGLKNGRVPSGGAGSVTGAGSGPGGRGRDPLGDGDSPQAPSGNPVDTAGDSPGAPEPNDKAKTKGDPVDVATGDVLLAETDMSLPGLLPLVIERTHRSSWRVGRWYGSGWLSSLDQRLEVGGGRVRGMFADGRVVTWPMPGTGNGGRPGGPVLPVAGAAWPLQHTEDGSYEVRDPQRGLTWRFERQPGYRQGIFGTGEFPLAAVTDRIGHRISFTYRADGSPEAVTHSGGYRVDITVEDGLVTGLTLAGDENLLLRYEYDENSNLTGIVNSSGLPQRLSYDDEGRLTGWEDRNGHYYRYGYDGEGRCVGGEGPGGALSGTFAYEPGVTRWTNSAGEVTTYEVTENALLTAQTDPLGNTVRWEHDERGNVTAIIDPLGRVTRYSFDDQGNMTAVLRPDGLQSATEYDERSLPVLLTEPDGSAWRQEYDELGNQVTLIAPDGAVTRFGHDASGHLSSVTDPDGLVTTVSCNDAGLPVMVTGPGGGQVRYERDHAGRVVRAISEDGGVTTLAWTPGGNLASRVFPDGTAESLQWDAEDNLVRYVSPAGAETRYEYGPFNNVIAMTDPRGVRSEYAYDHEMRITAARHDGLEWRYAYDAGGRLVTETDYNGVVTSSVFDAAGQVVTQVNGAGQQITFAWDECGNVVSRSAGEAVTEYGYDRAGRLSWARSPDADLRFSRDAQGRITAETCNGQTVTTAYDVAGRVAGRITPSGRASRWETGPSGEHEALTAGGHRLRFGYDPAARETSRELPGGARLSQDWDQRGRLTAQALTAAPGQPGLQAPGAGRQDLSAAGHLLQHRAYTYSPDSYLTGCEDLLNGSRVFGLDPSGRVTSASGPGWTESYSFDSLGNVTSAAWPSTPAPWLDTEAQGRREVSGTLVTRAGNIQYRHDAAGRVVSRHKTRISRKPDTWRYEWDAENRLTATILPDGTRWHYAYDPLGRRIAKRHLTPDGKVLAEVLFTWNGMLLVEQSETILDGAGDATASRITTWEYVAETFTPVVQYEATILPDAPQEDMDRRFYAIITDLVGTPTELLAPDGTLAGRQQHTIWGNTTWGSDGASTPLRFPGQYEDPETGLCYNNQRYYDPVTASYLSPDPLGLAPSPNIHAYVPNPHAEADPLGLIGNKKCKDGTRTVYRGDRRSPAEIRAAGGFKARGTSTDLRKYAVENIPSVFIGTSKKWQIARNFVARKGGWVYEIHAPRDEGVDVNKELGFMYKNRTEKEIAYQGEIPLDWIVRARPSYWYAWRGPWESMGASGE